MQLNIKPAFKTVANKQPFERIVVTHHPLKEGEKKRKGPSFTYHTETADAEGHMVFFPQGHSVLITDSDELKRLGFAHRPHRVEMETGEIVPENIGDDLENDPEEIVKRRTKSSGRLTGGVEAALA